MSTSKKDFTPEDLANGFSAAAKYRGFDGTDAEAPPVGYVTIAMSTQGNMNAPAFIYARSFKSREMTQLALVQQDKLAENNVRLIRSVSHQDVSPSTWHINEVIEFLLKHYIAFFGDILQDMAWPVNDDDLKYLQANSPEEFDAYKKGDYVPRVNIPSSSLKFLDLEKPVKNIVLKSKEGTFAFRMPQFGDLITLQTFLNAEFASQDAQFEDVVNRYKENPSSVSKQEQEAYEDYVSDRLEVATDVNTALLLASVDGQPVESLDEALRLVMEDPRFDYGLNQALRDEVDKVSATFGPDPEITLENPITGKLETRRFSFRLYDIFQAIRLSRSSRYDIKVES